MFAKLSLAFKRGLRGRRRPTRSAPVVAELEGRALMAALVPHQPLYVVVDGVKVTMNSFQPGGGATRVPATPHLTGTVVTPPVVSTGGVFTGGHFGQVYGSLGAGGRYGGTGGIFM
jgi:hypothetical protein